MFVFNYDILLERSRERAGKKERKRVRGKREKESERKMGKGGERGRDGGTEGGRVLHIIQKTLITCLILYFRRKFYNYTICFPDCFKKIFRFSLKFLVRSVTDIEGALRRRVGASKREEGEGWIIITLCI